jgi:hypothetical protein
VGTRERVRAAIDAPTAEAARLIGESPSAGDAQRLTVLIDGWCRGLAAAIEELAVSIDALDRGRYTAAGEPTRVSAEQPEAAAPGQPVRVEERTEPADEPAASESELAERVKAARAETAALRAESEATRDGGDVLDADHPSG